MEEEQTSTKYVIEYSKSGRAKCKKCKEVIEKDAPRIGIIPPPTPDGVVFSQWLHVGCFKTPQKGLVYEEVEGIQLMTKDIQDQLNQILSVPFQRAKPQPKKAITTNSQVKKEEEEDVVVIETITQAKKPVVKKRKKKIDSDEEEEEEEEDDDFGEDLEEDEKPKKKTKSSVKVRGNVTTEKITSSTQQKKVDVEGVSSSADDPLVQKYKKMVIADLKAILRTNHQMVSGTKDELVERCLDGEKNGALPKCPLCGKGNLHLKDDRVSCKGYFDSDINVHITCKYVDDASKVQRGPWTAIELSSESSAEASNATASATPADLAANNLTLSEDEIRKFKELRSSAPKQLALDMIEKARVLGLSVPSDDAEARQAVGGIIMASFDDLGDFSPIIAFKEIATKYPSKKTKEESMIKARMPENTALAHAFDELAKKEIAGGGEHAVFKAKACKQAAVAIRGLDFIVTNGASLAKPGKNKVPGIGKGSAKYIDMFLEHGVMEPVTHQDEE